MLHVRSLGLRCSLKSFLNTFSRNALTEQLGLLSTFTQRTHTCGELTPADVSTHVTVCGWLQHIRHSGLFLVLRDAYGLVQAVLSNPEDAKQVANLPLESVVQLTGTIQLRPPGQANEKMKSGEIEILTDSVKVLNRCNAMLPFHIHDFHEVKESLRLQHRYLDLRHPEMQHNLRLRSTLLFKMREFLCQQHNFVDVETPTLFRRTPGGAREFVVPTHMAGKYYTLPQSPQQFKQLLMVGGIDRYIQIARCYRDESSKPDRQPEFTQLDVEMSFVTQDDVKNLIEAVLQHCWPPHLEPLCLPLPRISYAEAIQQYGSDKPDTRYGNLLHNVTELFTGCKFLSVAEAVQHSPHTSVHALRFPSAAKHLTRGDLTALSDVIDKAFPTKRPFYAVVRVKDAGLWQGRLQDHLGVTFSKQLSQHLELAEGDLLALSAGDTTQACLLLGRLRVEIARQLQQRGFDVYDKDKMKLLWVEDFPLFLPKEDGSEGLESAHHPFTAPHPDDTHLVYTDPPAALSQHYDLVLNGNEIGGGSIRIHNAHLQRHILTTVLGESTSSLEHLLEALDYGCPPHGGIALGIDRLVAILCGESSIREVIAFPKSSEGRCLMSGAPSPVTTEDVAYYHLADTDSSVSQTAANTVEELSCQTTVTS